MTADLWTIASGATLYAGCAAPSGGSPTISAFASNRVADVLEAANGYTINGVSGQPGGSTVPNGKFDYSGGCDAPEQGVKGSMLFCGGGHNGWYGAEVIRLDYATGLFSRVTNAYKTLWNINTSNYASNGDGETYADSSGTTTLQTQPGAAHMYDHAVYLAPGVGGSGSLGGLLTVSRYGTSPSAGGGNRTHMLDIASGVWARFSTNVIQTDTFGGGDMPFTSVCYDKVRGKIFMPDAGWNLRILTLSTKTWTLGPQVGSAKPASPAAPKYGTFRHLASLDLYAFFFHEGTQGVALCDPTNLAAGWVVATISGTFPANPGGWEWDDANKRALYYAGDASKTCTILTAPSSSPKTNAWTISTKAATGVTPTLNDSGHPHQSRFRWVSGLNAAIWIGSALDYGTRWDNL